MWCITSTRSTSVTTTLSTTRTAAGRSERVQTWLPQDVQLTERLVDVGQPTPDAAFDVDHPLAGDPQRWIEGRDRISDVVAEESTGGRLAHGRVHAHVGGDSGGG